MKSMTSRSRLVREREREPGKRLEREFEIE